MEQNLHPAVVRSAESPRGCGTRKKGGIYVVSGAPAASCGKLPVSLDRLNVCSNCGHPHPPDVQVIKPSRAPRWLPEPERLWHGLECHSARLESGMCVTCPLSNGFETGPALLIWVGEKYYKTPADFLRESQKMGISRRIPAVPKDFKLGETFILLAHVKAFPYPVEIEADGQIAMVPRTDYKPGIFSIFRPSKIEVIVDGTESDEEIDRYVERGLTPVLVEPSGEATPGAEQPQDDEEITEE